MASRLNHERLVRYDRLRDSGYEPFWHDLIPDPTPYVAKFDQMTLPDSQKLEPDASTDQEASRKKTRNECDQIQSYITQICRCVITGSPIPVPYRKMSAELKDYITSFETPLQWAEAQPLWRRTLTEEGQRLRHQEKAVITAQKRERYQTEIKTIKLELARRRARVKAQEVAISELKQRLEKLLGNPIE